MGRIICIKARSHSDFELYLIGEKYDIPYDFLIGYKRDVDTYKFWTELGTGKVLALEERKGSVKSFVPILPLSDSKISEIRSIKPILAGEVMRKYAGEISEKEEEFKEMLAGREKKRKEMLSRKYDPSNIVCINARSTNEQIFAVCVFNDIEYAHVASFIDANSHVDMTRVWFEKGTSELVAFEYPQGIYERFEINEDCLIPREAIRRMNRKPTPTPRIKVTQESVDAYRNAIDMGFDLDIPKLERALCSDIEEDDIDMVSVTVEDLKDLLQAAVDREDYESAAELRDAIRDLEKRS